MPTGEGKMLEAGFYVLVALWGVVVTLIGKLWKGHSERLSKVEEAQKHNVTTGEFDKLEQLIKDGHKEQREFAREVRSKWDEQQRDMRRFEVDIVRRVAEVAAKNNGNHG